MIATVGWISYASMQAKHVSAPALPISVDRADSVPPGMAATLAAAPSVSLVFAIALVLVAKGTV